MLCYSLMQRHPEVEHVHGATMGQEAIQPLLLELGAGMGQVVLLDFEGIATATSSYVKATVAQLVRAGKAATEAASGTAVAGPPLNVFPIVANLSDDVAEELKDVLKAQGLSVVEATMWKAAEEVARKGRLLGDLDAAGREAMLCLSTFGSAANATELTKRFRAEVMIGETGWNNRLAELYRQRLVRRTKEGRQWQYELVAREVSIDG